MPLALRDVVVSFGPVCVLAGVDLVLERGEAVALMGPSGSGKTTLLSVIAGLRAPDQGSRTLTDEGGHALAPDDLSTAWVFQTSPVLMHRTGLDNAALGPRSAGVGRALSRQRALESLGRLGVAHLADQRLHRLSGGERQRVVIARAMAAEAALVIADEPTAALDGHAKERVCDALAAAAGSGAAVVVATHDPAVASSCGRVLHLVDGRLAERAP